MKLKCIDKRLNFVAFDENKRPHRVEVGNTFEIAAKTFPAKWRGLVTVVEGPADSDEDEPKVAVTNPAPKKADDNPAPKKAG